MTNEGSELSRRKALLKVAALAGGGLLAGQLRATSGKPEIAFPTISRERLSVTSYPFRAYIESPSNKERDASKKLMDLKDFAGMVAKRFRVYNINPVVDHFQSTDAAYLDELRASVEAAKSHFADLGLSGRNFYDADKLQREEAVKYGMTWIDVAKHLGSPSVRQHIHASKGAVRSVPIAAESLGQMAEYGSKQGIVVNLENDSAVTEDPFFIIAVIERVKSPYLRALPDFGNSMQQYDEAFNERAVKAMFGHAYNMSHVKNVITNKGGAVYKIDVAKMFAIAKASGYKGYFSMEYDSGSGDPFAGTDELIRESMSALNQS
jgi:sugar phosphate isomerase/epimerase